MADKAQVVFGSVPVQATVSEAPRRTLTELVGIAKEVWEDICTFEKENPNATNAQRMKHAQSINKDFTDTFPVVVRWMVADRSFDARVFKDFVERTSRIKILTKDDFLTVQAEYPCSIARAQGYGEGHLKAHYEKTLQSLRRETDIFEAASDVAKSEAAEAVACETEDLRKRLIEYLLTRKGRGVEKLRPLDSSAPA